LKPYGSKNPMFPLRPTRILEGRNHFTGALDGETTILKLSRSKTAKFPISQEGPWRTKTPIEKGQLPKAYTKFLKLPVPQSA